MEGGGASDSIVHTVPTWNRLKELVDYEFVQSREEGRDPALLDALYGEYLAAGDDQDRVRAVWDRVLAVPLRHDLPFDEPDDLASIRARGNGRSWAVTLSYGDDALYDRLYGAWLGRCAGCALGKPVETANTIRPDDPFTSRARLKAYLQAPGPGEYPLNDYISGRAPAGTPALRLICPSSTRERIAFMEPDDDLRYTVVGQCVLHEHGPTFTTEDVARVWLQSLPYGLVCSAEAAAYRNIVLRYGCDCDWPDREPLDVAWVATHQNPYREWIGAQIRADSYGYAAPGRPKLAAELAWRDARLSHVKNGLYGAMLCAAMIAAAFATDDPARVGDAGLSVIPRSSRLYQAMERVVAICQGHDRHADAYEAVLDEIYALLGRYHPIHTINNAALVVAALLLGGRDFEKVITIAVMGGWDTDCNGATAGSIAVAMLGAHGLPAKWTGPLHDTLRSGIAGYDPIAISVCARRSLEIARAWSAVGVSTRIF